MGNNLDMFEIGRKGGASQRSTFGRTTDTLMDQFKTERDTQTKLRGTLGAQMALKKYENELPPTEKEKAQTNLDTAKVDWMKNNPQVAEGMVLDSVSASGPRFVNQEARLQQARALSQSKDLPKLDRAFDAVQQLKTQYDSALSPVSIERGSNPIVGAIQKGKQGLAGKIGSISGSNPQLNRYMANKEGFASLLSKGGFMEAGVLTNEDIKRMTNILPNEFSSKQEADIAWKEVEQILQSAKQRFEQMTGGVSGQSRADVPSNDQTNTNPEDALFQKLKAKYGAK